MRFPDVKPSDREASIKDITNVCMLLNSTGNTLGKKLPDLVKLASQMRSVQGKMQTSHKQLELREKMEGWGQCGSVKEQKAFIDTMGSEIVTSTELSPLLADLDSAFSEVLQALCAWVVDPSSDAEPAMDSEHMHALLHGAETLHKALGGQGESIQRDALLTLVMPHLQLQAELSKEEKEPHSDVQAALPRTLHLQSLMARCSEAIANGQSKNENPAEDSAWCPPANFDSAIASMKMVQQSAEKRMQKLGNDLLGAVQQSAKESVQALNSTIGAVVKKPVWCMRLEADCSWEALIAEAEKTLLKAGYSAKVKAATTSLQEV